MTRSQFQPGPADDHYHDTLGVNEDITGEQRIRLLVSDEIDLATMGSAITALTIPAEALLVKAFVLRSNDATTGASPSRINLRLAPADQPNSMTTLMTYDLTNAYAGNVDEGLLMEDGGDTFAGDLALLFDAYARAAQAPFDTIIRVTKQNITDGLLRVYALIAEPV